MPRVCAKPVWEQGEMNWGLRRPGTIGIERGRSRAFYLHQHLALAGASKFQFLDDHHLRVGVRQGKFCFG
ncbi:MAG: hypothetical protein H8E27_13955 [Verrucomicrobia subdivision 3 bacterium]|nr:hypothetical protein [Limisphaerales bacterium]